jgi:hypothetical protein
MTTTIAMTTTTGRLEGGEGTDEDEQQFKERAGIGVALCGLRRQSEGYQRPDVLAQVVEERQPPSRLAVV